MFDLHNEKSGEVICPLSKKEVRFLEENLETDVGEGDPFVLTEDGLFHLILCDATEALAEKLRGALADEDSVLVSWSRH